MSEHRAIWLEPSCVANSGEDRHWCQDDTWGACEECGTKSVKYIIATEHEALVQALQALIDQVNDYERVNNLAPNPGRSECWDTVARAKEVLDLVGSPGLEGKS